MNCRSPGVTSSSQRVEVAGCVGTSENVGTLFPVFVVGCLPLLLLFFLLHADAVVVVVIVVVVVVMVFVAIVVVVIE